ncbi:MAG: beta-propeller domain-containing protein, partial [Candidatus Nanoarchaeia archaeon]
YILDKDMGIVGRLEGLAPGERIYSTRFMGNRGYMVTFRNIDPLFALDLSDPEDPKVLGKLKIPGYSDYLHPYDENHIIGIGKDTEESDAGDFAWYQGMKMAIFDVTDVENPKQIHKVLIGDRGTDSPVLHNHKALLFDKEKELLVIPILVAQIKDKESVEEWSYGEYIYQGAYVFKINLKEGFVLRGKITHYDEDSFGKGRYFYGDQRSIERSLYIDNVLYTVSQKSIQLNDLDDLNFIKKLDFKQQVEEEEEEIIY